jgi:hypothetical protein
MAQTGFCLERLHLQTRRHLPTSLKQYQGLAIVPALFLALPAIYEGLLSWPIKTAQPAEF